MNIGGLVPFSLCDYPGQVAAVIFTQGCNFRCPFCHNGSLIPIEPTAGQLIPEELIFDFLEKRRENLDAVVVSGGEPTIQSDLRDFLHRVKARGYSIKLDTNGSRPNILQELLQWRLIDYIAMDIKAPLEIYDRLTGVRPPIDQICRSIDLVARSGIDHEFRTTVVNSLLAAEDVQAIQKIVPPGSRYRLQDFRPEHALDPALRAATVVSGDASVPKVENR
ncbi:MAG: anaerobic ribonucleoside-triphosphate reductase activating protein [Planctomycetes bacterium]|nr:anaerobic ribonucleoside-triphosphate reductase activating protein [Planctomycetota bacterium]